MNHRNMLSLEGMRGHLLHNLILFGRVLRGLGMKVNPGRMLEVMDALEYVEIGRRSDFYHTLRGILVNNKTDLPLFDEAFEMFWQKPSEGGMDLNLRELMQRRRPDEPQTFVVPPPMQEDGNRPQKQDEADDDEPADKMIEVTRTYSNRERLSQRDFAEMNQTELTAVKRLMRQLVWQLGRRQTRRLKPGRRGNRIDLRRSLRRSFRYGGEMLEWPRRERKIKPRPLIVLADISGSMERYARLLIHFLYSLALGMEQKVEVFTFGTRLTRITRELSNKNVDVAIDEVAQTVQDWSGGTRIGRSLRTFNVEWSRRVMRGGPIVLIISDGWDRGDPAVLGREMGRLQRTCYRLVWLNPLLGSKRYEPLTRGIQAALPHIDDFLPVHNLASLEELADHVRLIGRKRPGRGSARSKRLEGAAFIGGRKQTG